MTAAKTFEFIFHDNVNAKMVQMVLLLCDPVQRDAFLMEETGGLLT